LLQHEWKLEELLLEEKGQTIAPNIYAAGVLNDKLSFLIYAAGVLV
jgi:hypothetical protein